MQRLVQRRLVQQRGLVDANPEHRSLNIEAILHGGVRPFHQKSACLTQLTGGPYVVQSWSRNTPDFRGAGNPRTPPSGTLRFKFRTLNPLDSILPDTWTLAVPSIFNPRTAVEPYRFSFTQDPASCILSHQK